MKPIILSVITALLFFNACAQESKDNSAGQPSESQKKKKEIYPVEQYYPEDGKHWKVMTTVTLNKISGNIRTVVAVNLRQGQSWKFASHRFNKKIYFLG